MRFGNVDLHLVSDGLYWSDGAGMFGVMPKTEWQKIWEPDERNRIPLEQRCLLIETDAQRILVDTGSGDKISDKERSFTSLTGERRLQRSLEALGVEPEDIDIVINTHLHGDHCGGNTYWDSNSSPVPVFPRATYCVQRLELSEARFPNERTRAVYHLDNFEPLERSGQLNVLQGDTRLTSEVRVMHTPGHTPGHQSVVVESGGQTAIFLGDVATWPIHIERLACVAAYDVQPLVSIETKRRLAQWAIENQVLLIFEHHPEIAAGYLQPTDRPDCFQLKAMEVDL
jgi:glyoxylase-like metal-dependent hydrolase (beta-lactamase superfamily II)